MNTFAHMNQMVENHHCINQARYFEYPLKILDEFDESVSEPESRRMTHRARLFNIMLAVPFHMFSCGFGSIKSLQFEELKDNNTFFCTALFPRIRLYMACTEDAHKTCNRSMQNHHPNKSCNCWYNNEFFQLVNRVRLSTSLTHKSFLAWHFLRVSKPLNISQNLS